MDLTELRQELASLEALMARASQDPGRFPSARALAATAGLEAPALEHLFLEHAHLGAGAFLRRARIQAACRRLLGASAPAWEAGRACGFSSPATFLAQFRAATGILPGEYQALGRAGAAGRFTLALPWTTGPEDILAYHGRDPLSLSEKVEGPPC